MIVYYARSHTLISLLIRLFTWSPWSHVAVLEPNDEWVLEARFPRCRRVRLQTFLDDNDVVVPKEEYCPRPDLATQWGRKQCGYDPMKPDEESEGLPYDVMGVFAFMLPILWWIEKRDWTRPGQWFCTEFKTFLFRMGYRNTFQEEATNRITPFLSWILAGRVLPRVKG
jgi:hypothetical protein